MYAVAVVETSKKDKHKISKKFSREINNFSKISVFILNSQNNHSKSITKKIPKFQSSFLQTN